MADRSGGPEDDKPMQMSVRLIFRRVEIAFGARAAAAAEQWNLARTVR